MAGQPTSSEAGKPPGNPTQLALDELRLAYLGTADDLEIKQKHWATYFGVPESTVSAWANGKRLMSEEQLTVARVLCEIERDKREDVRNHILSGDKGETWFSIAKAMSLLNDTLTRAAKSPTVKAVSVAAITGILGAIAHNAFTKKK